MGAVIHQALLDLGGSNPARGVQTILEALVEVAAPPEQMQDLFALGQRRLEQQQALHAIPNPTGYLIGIMRNVAVEGLLKGWNVAQMREEDEEQHAQALRSRGHGEPEAQAPAAEAAPAEAAAEAPDAVARPAPDATSARTKAAEDDEPAAPEARPAPEPADTEEAERYATMPVDPRARQVWRSALERIRPNISQSAFTTWLSGTSGLVFEPDALIVRVGSSFSRDHLENRFQDLIASALSEQLRATTEAHFVVIPEFEEDRA